MKNYIPLLLSLVCAGAYAADMPTMTSQKLISMAKPTQRLSVLRVKCYKIPYTHGDQSIQNDPNNFEYISVYIDPLKTSLLDLQEILRDKVGPGDLRFIYNSMALDNPTLHISISPKYLVKNYLDRTDPDDQRYWFAFWPL